MKGVLVIAVLLAASAGALPNGCSRELSTTLLPDFKDCAAFWKCADGVPLLQACPQGLHFSARLQHCTLPVLAHCQATADDAPVHTAFTSGFLDTLRNIISRNVQPVTLVKDELSVAPELPNADLPEDTIRRFPDVETDEAEKSMEAGSKSEGRKFANVEVEGELDMGEEMEEEEEVGDGKEEQESEPSEEKITEEEDEKDSVKEEPEEKINETSDVEDVIAENDGENVQASKKDASAVKKKDEEEKEDEKDSEEGESEEKIDETSDVEDVIAENDGENMENSKKDVTVVKKKDEEEEDEDKKKSKDVKRIKMESKKNKSEEKDKDSGSDDESEDEE